MRVRNAKVMIKWIDPQGDNHSTPAGCLTPQAATPTINDLVGSGKAIRAYAEYEDSNTDDNSKKDKPAPG